jgi:hypothetical protein
VAVTAAGPLSGPCQATVKKSRTPLRDAAGQPIRVGDRVRLLEIPPLRPRNGQPAAQLRAVLARLRRSYKRIERVSADGRIEVVFYVRVGPHQGLHTVRLNAKYFAKRR